jgi:hypothetical protein
MLAAAVELKFEFNLASALRRPSRLWRRQMTRQQSGRNCRDVTVLLLLAVVMEAVIKNNIAMMLNARFTGRPSAAQVHMRITCCRGCKQQNLQHMHSKNKSSCKVSAETARRRRGHISSSAEDHASPRPCKAAASCHNKRQQTASSTKRARDYLRKCYNSPPGDICRSLPAECCQWQQLRARPPRLEMASSACAAMRVTTATVAVVMVRLKE